MNLLEIAVVAGEHGPVVFLSGEADLTTGPELTAALTAQIDAGARLLTVDLSGLTFADSATIRVLIVASHALRDRGGTLELSRPQSGVARALTLLGVDRVIPVRGGAGAEIEHDHP